MLNYCKKQGVQISMIKIREPAQNGYAERLMRTIKKGRGNKSNRV